MTLTLELTEEEAARLRASAQAQGVDEQELLRNLIADLPAGKPRTGAELVAQLQAEGLIGSYGDPGLDAPELARKLRAEAERRG